MSIKFDLCSGQLSLLKEKLAAERKEEQSWRDELREISGNYKNLIFMPYIVA